MSSQYRDIPGYGDLHWKAPVDTAADLPTVNNLVGDARVAQDTSVIYIWNGSNWVANAGTAGVSSLNGETGAVTLVAGSNITITPSGGNITIAASSGSSLTASDSVVITSNNITLVNDTATPGNSKYYGTNSGGTLGYYSIPISGINQLTGDVTAGPGTGSQVATLAATSNGTLTTLSALTTATSLASIGTITTGVWHGTAISLTSYASGTLQAAQFPALTGDITTSAGSLATAAAATQNNITSIPNLATVGTIGTGTWEGTTVASAYGGTGFSTYTKGDILYASATNVLSKLGIGSTGNVLTVASGLPSWAAPATAGTVTSVALSDGSTSPIYTISGSPVTSSGTLTFTLGTQSANKVFAGPTTGSAAQPTFRSLVGADLPNPSSSTLGGIQSLAAVTSKWINTISTAGVPSATQPAFTDISGSVAASQMPALTGDVTTSAGAVATSLVATTNATLTTLSALTTASSLASVGTITSGTWNGTTVAIAHGGTGQTSASAAFNALSPITTTGDIIYSSSGTTNSRLGIGTTGQVLTVSGGLPSWQTAGAGSGTVTSVGLADSTGIFNVTGTPVTTSGTLTLSSLVTQAINTVLAGPPAAGNVVTQFTTGSGNFTVPVGYTLTTITLNGGGGGSGGQSGGVGSSGGGGGGYISYTTSQPAGTVVAYSVGAGGTAGGIGATSGGNGGATSCSTYSLTANGGGLGANGASGGTGGTATGGTTNTTGSAGTVWSGATGGNGGSSAGSAGGATQNGNSGNGTAGNTYGGGASGSGTSGNQGAVGAAGQITFTCVGATSFRALVSADIPNNAANTTGTAANITASSNSTLTSLSALTTAGGLSTVGTIGTGTWNGTTVAIAHGGSGQTSASAAFNALSPITSTGDLILGNGSNSATRLGIGANTFVLTSNGTTASWQAAAGGGITALTGDVTASGSGSVAATLAATTNGTLTTLSALTSASSLATVGTITSGTWNGTTVAIAHGGTGTTSAPTQYGVIYASTTTALASTAAGTTGQVLTATTSSAPTWSALPAPTLSYASGYNAVSGGGGEGWTIANQADSYTAATCTGTSSYTSRASSGITITQAASNGMGIVFTPSSSTAVYQVTARFNMANNAGGGAGNIGSQMYNNTQSSTITTGPDMRLPGVAVAATIVPVTISAIFAPASSSAQTILIRGYADSTVGANGIFMGYTNGSSAAENVEWTVVQIGV